MPDELAAERGAGSDAVSTLSNYLAIRLEEVKPAHFTCQIAFIASPAKPINDR
jgi:hypothetical protein